MYGLEDETYAVRLGKLLKLKRQAKKWSQSELAELVFDDADKRSRISEYERGKHEPRDILPTLIKTLDISREELEVVEKGDTPAKDVWHSISGNFLPSAPRNLIGQEATCDTVHRHILSHQPSGLLLHGMGGVGKTAIVSYAVESLHQRQHLQFFFLNVHGFDGDIDEEAQLTQALTRLIRRFSEFEGQLPEATTDLIMLWKETSRRIDQILILDNIANQKHLDALFPIGKLPWLATSRHRLTVQGKAKEITLLRADEGSELAISVCKVLSYDLKPKVADRLAEFCDGLPLAIEVAASTIAITPSLNIEEFLSRLADERKRVALAEDWEEAVMARLQVSVDQMTREVRSAWSHLGLFKGGFFIDSAQALLPDADMHTLLSGCERRHLLSSSHKKDGLPIRFYLHDLLRAVALRLFDQFETAHQTLIKRAFSQHFATFISQAVDLSKNRLDTFETRAKIKLEIENLRSALEFSLEDEQDIDAVERVLSILNSQELRQEYPVDDRLKWLEKATALLSKSENQFASQRYYSLKATLVLTRCEMHAELGHFEDAEAIIREAIGDERLINTTKRPDLLCPASL